MTINIFSAGTLQSIDGPTGALELLTLRCGKKGECFVGAGQAERVELFNRHPQNLGAIGPGWGPETRKRNMDREDRV